MAQQIGWLLVSATLARLLTPRDYGLFGMTMLIIGAAASLNGLGLAHAIVQRRELSPEHLSTCFWLAQASAVALVLIVWGVSPLVAAFFEEPRVGPMLVAASLHFPLASLSLVQAALLTRDLAFRQITIYAVPAVTAGWGISIGAASAGAGPWSLLGGSLASAFFTALLYWWKVPWRPRLWVSPHRAREMTGFALSVAGSQFLSFANSNLDYLVVGRYLGASALGAYTLAYQLATIPQNQIASSVTGVMFPAFSAIQDDTAQIRRGYFRSLRVLALLGLPVLTGLSILAPEFITVVYGTSWAEAIPLIRVLSILGCFYFFGTTVGPLLDSRGRPDVGLRWNVVKCLLLTVGFALAIRWGTLGIAWVSAIVAVTGVCWIQYRVNAMLSLDVREYVRNLAGPIGVTTVMALTMLILRAVALELGMQPTGTLLVAGVTGAAVFGVGLWLFERSTLRQLVSFAVSRQLP